MSFIISPPSTTGVVAAPYTVGGVVYANGAGPLVTAAGTSGQVLQSPDPVGEQSELDAAQSLIITPGSSSQPRGILSRLASAFGA